ncbi:MAG: helix-turn-helix domain-containing protein [Oceanococcus sp.]|nr:MAG: helix-turn-helix domain-containing protein [Oceanococcus sp.]
MSLTEVAREAGFSDSAHFTHSFRRTYGLPPNLLKLIGEHGMPISCG